MRHVRNRSCFNRRIAAEPLEGRLMLAADVSISHNFAVPEDVNADSVVAPLDALVVINHLNGSGSEGPNYPDVSGDGVLSPRDALGIINRMNQGIDTPSAASLTDRIAVGRLALASGGLPAHISDAEAEGILATMEAGGFPEIGERLMSGQIVNLPRAAEIVDRVAELDVDWGTDPPNILSRVADFLRSADGESPLLVEVSHLLHDLGVETDPYLPPLDGVYDNSRAPSDEAAEYRSEAVAGWLGQLRDTLANNGHAISNALDQARHELVFGTVGDYLPGIRDALQDGATPLQDFLDNLETQLEDPEDVANRIEIGFDRDSVRVSDILSSLFDR